MGRARHAQNPAKVRAQISALDRGPPPEVFRRRVELRRQLSMALICALTVVLLTVSFAPFDQWYLGYVAMVPWLLGLAWAGRKRAGIFWATLTGALFWAANLYWLWWITLTGYAAMLVYLSVYWLAAAFLVRSASRRGWPMWIVFPVVWVALEYARAHVISGFPWFFLAHGQYGRTRLIQIADLTGQYGVSFFVAMANGALADLLKAPLFVRGDGRPRLRRSQWYGAVASLLACGALLGYGTWRLSQATTSPGPVIALVQGKFPISLRGRGATPQKILDSHVRLSESLVGRECDAVVIPEAMLPVAYNAGFRGLDVSAIPPEAVAKWAEQYCHPRDRKVYHDRLAELLRAWQQQRRGARESEGVRRLERLSRGLECPILAGGSTLHLNAAPMNADDYWLLNNSAMGFDGNSQGPIRRSLWAVGRAGRARLAGDALGTAGYSKVHLVPFGEYVPFKRSAPWLHRVLGWFVPAVMDQLEPGEEFTYFELKRSSPGPVDRTWRVATPICYEGTFARVCRRMVVKDGRKAVDILVNMSNDGWFVWRQRGSTEHAQHLAQYCFRAVENRTPVVRAVNTGISASIDSNGRIVSVLQEYDGMATMIDGTLLLDGGRQGRRENLQHGPLVLVDRRVSVYSRIGDVFALVVGLLGLVLAVWLACKRPGSPQGATK